MINFYSDMLKAFFTTRSFDKEAWTTTFRNPSSFEEFANLLDDPQWKESIDVLKNLKQNTPKKVNELINEEIAKGNEAELNTLKTLIENLSNLSDCIIMNLEYEFRGYTFIVG